MTPAHVVQITTPKKYVLNGLWFGPKKPKRVIIWVHGLTSSAFSMLHTVKAVVDDETAVLTFNNRGHDVVSRLYSVKRTGKAILAGGAHERFVDSVDDIQGAVTFVRKQKIKNIFLAGHSTGCQKAAYWAYKKNGGNGVKGIILVAPVSDYAAARKLDKDGKLNRATRIARALVKSGKPNALIPSGLLTTWSVDDAQRFLSLYTPESPENIFPYDGSKRDSLTLQKVRKPTLVLWAECDQYADRPVKEIAGWFEKNLKNRHKVAVVPKVGHSFRGGEKIVAKEIREFMKER